MSTSMLNIKPQEIDNAQKRRKHRVSIIGCGRNGIIHACLFAEAGFNVICVDENRLIVKLIASGKTPFLKREIKPLLKKHVRNRCLETTSNIDTAVEKSDVIAITTEAKIDKKKNVNYLDIEKMCRQVGSSLRRGSLVIIMSTVAPGTTEGLIRETLENTSGFKVGKDFGLAYSQVHVPNENIMEKMRNFKRVVAATDKDSLNAASAILSIISRNTATGTNDIKTAEATKLFESVKHYTNIALANEFALYCEKAGIDYVQIQKLAEPNVDSTFFSPAVTCVSTHEEPCLLMEEAENLNVKLRMPTVAIDINEEMLKHAVNLIREALRKCGKTLRRARISILGVSRTPDTKDLPKTSARKLVAVLESKGCKVSLYDPYLSGRKLTSSGYSFKKRLKDAIEGADCLVIFTGHKQFKRLSLTKLKILARMPVAIVDFEGIIDPDKVEAKGFIYRGLGRGVWTK